MADQWTDSSAMAHHYFKTTPMKYWDQSQFIREYLEEKSALEDCSSILPSSSPPPAYKDIPSIENAENIWLQELESILMNMRLNREIRARARDLKNLGMMWDRMELEIYGENLKAKLIKNRQQRLINSWKL
ncbi:hypothetical protein BGZ51_007665 [Haplosporangium sp. Z 767]|nr:hypothetical protein BGZ50_007664 [Haplosporangium sp. Z 11]KAF9178587.1 hypothetical protein BGZ51_007665 [Haplosporangium sp. Z 767]